MCLASKHGRIRVALCSRMKSGILLELYKFVPNSPILRFVICKPGSKHILISPFRDPPNLDFVGGAAFHEPELVLAVQVSDL